MYTTGVVEKALVLFLGLLRGSRGWVRECGDDESIMNSKMDRLFLDDFRVTLEVCAQDQ